MRKPSVVWNEVSGNLWEFVQTVMYANVLGAVVGTLLQASRQRRTYSSRLANGLEDSIKQQLLRVVDVERAKNWPQFLRVDDLRVHFAEVMAANARTTRHRVEAVARRTGRMRDSPGVGKAIDNYLKNKSGKDADTRALASGISVGGRDVSMTSPERRRTTL